ncbi:MAG: hypothetical protein QM778_00525 [Myxococcales bacterium]
MGGTAEFDGALVSVLQHRPADCEVLVVHTEPYDDPYNLADEVSFIETSGNSLIELVNASLDLATSDVLHIVGCGLEATERWTDAALEHFNDPDVAAVSPLVMSDSGELISAGLSWTLGGNRRVLKNPRIASPGAGTLASQDLGPTLQAAFYRREVLVALGGFDIHVGDSLADADLALAIRSLGRAHHAEPAARLIQVGTAPQPAVGKFSTGRASERLFWRYAAGNGVALSLGFHALSIRRRIDRAPLGRRPCRPGYGSIGNRCHSTS